MPNLSVVQPGLQTTVQDLGRITHQIDGFPTSGSMDQAAHRLANLLVDNPGKTAVLEFALVGPTLVFRTETFIALTGGQFSPSLNGKPIPQNQAIRIQKNDRLTIGAVETGRYGYLAIKGGIQVPPVMGSRSTTLRIGIGGFHGRALAAGDQLPITTQNVLSAYAHRQVSQQFLKHFCDPLLMLQSPLTIRILKGPQWHLFSTQDHQRLQHQQYRLTADVDRMGYRLAGKPLVTQLKSLLSEATVFGGIQLTTDGQPIVLLADRQTTGGYPVIATVLTADIGKLVQCQPHQLIQFQLTDLQTAQAELHRQTELLQRLKVSFIDQRYQNPIGINRAAAQRIRRLFP
ncbi:urea carboxylase [Lentilactobacillus fungorum]|uniref:Urea carboxylase n=1 Tax=Lentilactobacillus fungorum TaxID=2201250 RepID=A0ABQ3VYK3_9LACO|nr:biotin-dependent carboxyltransferase family protein [Lentilactobacillus fungorum]GHP13424.1 urea carboxylase [Lentilactobacillus fungorum]